MYTQSGTAMPYCFMVYSNDEVSAPFQQAWQFASICWIKFQCETSKAYVLMVYPYEVNIKIHVIVTCQYLP